jgi:hypothetical protein
MMDLRSRTAWRGAFTACLLNALGTPLDWVIGRNVPGMPWWPPFASSAAGVMLALVLFAKRHEVSERSSSLAFIVNTACIVTSLWLTATVYAHRVPNWVPYQANELGALASAFLTPSLWSGLVAVALFSGSAILHYLLLPVELQARFFAEPWATLTYGMFGAALVAYNVHRQEAEAALQLARAQSAAVERLAAASLAIRDLASTPFQTMALAVENLRIRCPGAQAQLDVIARALERLNTLRSVLRRYEDAAANDGRASFDALDDLSERKRPGSP